MQYVKRKNECCCCFSKEDLFNMLEPHGCKEKAEIYSTLLAECFQIELNFNVDNRNLYLLCKKCVCRLRDAITLQSQVQIAYDNFQDLAEFYNMDENGNTWGRSILAKWKIMSRMMYIKREDECCCCFTKKDLLNMLEPYTFEGKSEIYSTMISECFQIELNLNINGCKRNLHLICKNCVTRLRDALMLRSQVQIACDRLRDTCFENDDLVEVPIECSNVADTKENIVLNPDISDSTEHFIINEDKIPIKCEEAETKENLLNLDASDDNSLKLKALKVVVEKLDNSMENITVISNRGHFDKFENTNGDNDVKSKPIFLCNICNKLFTNLVILRKHIFIHQNKCVHCDFCGRSYVGKANLQTHMMKHMDIKKFVCGDCGKRYALRNSFQSHVKVHSKVPSLKCKLCEETFFTKYLRKKHMLSHNPECVKCVFCSRIFNDKYNLYNHMKIHVNNHDKSTIVHSNVKPKSEICDKMFESKLTLREHNITHINQTCEISDKIFESKQMLMEHNITHINQTCEISDKIFESKQTLKEQKIADIDLTCEICNKTYESKRMFRKHKKTHVNLTCELCDKTLSSTYSLLRHQRLHLDFKCLICDYCKRTFTNKISLTKHVKSNCTKGISNVCGNSQFTLS